MSLTVAPATTAPCASVTTPDTLAVDAVCPKPVAGSDDTINTKIKKRAIFILPSLWVVEARTFSAFGNDQDDSTKHSPVNLDESSASVADVPGLPQSRVHALGFI